MNKHRQYDWAFFVDFVAPRRVLIPTLTADELSAAHRREREPQRLDGLGRKLLGEIDSYLEFFAIARSGT